MLYHDIKRWDNQLTEADFYEALDHMLADAYPHLDEAALEDLLDDLLDRLPDGQAEALMDSVASVAKQIGSGSLDFIRSYPGMAQGRGQGQVAEPNPAVGKVTALLNHPQMQTALVRGTLGMGSAPHANQQNGQVNQLSLTTYLRAIIASAQAALVELEKGGAASGLSEAIYGEDTDSQAEWLAEDLGGGAEAYYQESVTIGDDKGVSMENFMSTLDAELLSILKIIQNHKNVFYYENYNHLLYELKIRNNIIKAINKIEKDRIGRYPNSEESYSLGEAYWRAEEVHLHKRKRIFYVKDNIKGSDAIRSLLDERYDIVIDCNTMSVIVTYISLLNTFEDVSFDKIFPNSEGVIIGEWIQNEQQQGEIYAYQKERSESGKFYSRHPLQDTTPDNKYRINNGKRQRNLLKDNAMFPEVSLYQGYEEVNPEKDLIPGDIVYFKNYDNYKICNPNGLWTGLWAVYLGKNDKGDIFSGLGVFNQTKDEIFSSMYEAYKSGCNQEPKADEQQRISLTGIRVNIKEIMKRLNF